MTRHTLSRTISRNAHYMVLFKNLTEVSQIMALAHQMYPRRTQFFLEAFARATARPHGYMVIDKNCVLLGYIWCASAMICDTSVRFLNRTM
jgi:hypothetical protein